MQEMQPLGLAQTASAREWPLQHCPEPLRSAEAKRAISSCRRYRASPLSVTDGAWILVSKCQSVVYLAFFSAGLLSDMCALYKEPRPGPLLLCMQGFMPTPYTCQAWSPLRKKKASTAVVCL